MTSIQRDKMSEISKEELTKKVISDRPHVVILGAGASRATCPDGDKNGKKLPLMNDLVKCLNLESKVLEYGMEPKQDFEDLFSFLFDAEAFEETKELEKIIYGYFKSLELPNTPTIYDHLVLSLRETDLIASFNWDPLLLQAYRRNSNKGIRLPRLAFLHGNVRMGECKKHNRSNYVGEICERCKEKLEPVDLLYPITTKNYAQNNSLKINWDRFERHLSKAYQFTIFGYSGPRTDEEAVSIMKKAWKDKHSDKILADTTIISTNTNDEVYEHWKHFFHSQYYELVDDFYKSDIAKYPRRGFERSWENNMEAVFVEENPIPKNLDFPALWSWYHQFVETEYRYRIKNPFPKPPKWYKNRI